MTRPAPAPGPAPARAPVSAGLAAVAIAVAIAAIAMYLARAGGNAWDFETFYYAAAAIGRGLDPYRVESLSAVSGKTVVLQFLYPPAALAWFLPFTLLPVAAAATVWLAIKLAAAAALVVIWRRVFPEVGVAAIALMTVFGFNAALLWDLGTGNVAIVEQLLLWLAFACYVRDRRTWFAVLVCLGALFKLLPIVFLLLLLVPPRRPGTGGVLVASAIAFALVVLAPSLAGPAWARGFLGSLPATRPFGEVNPCALGLFDTLIGPGRWSGGDWRHLAGTRFATPGGADVALIAWALWVVAILVVSLGTLRRTWRSGDRAQCVAVACLLFALLSPRMMVYTYLLLVAPALRIVCQAWAGKQARAIAIGILLLQGVAHFARLVFKVPLPEMPYPAGVALMNLSFVLTLALWGAWIADDARVRRGSGRQARSRRDR